MSTNELPSKQTPSKSTTPTDIKQTVENHKQAATHHQEAAKQHLEAAKNHETGNHDKANDAATKAKHHCDEACKSREKAMNEHSKK